jgi:D-inositol-3-phosphate glycosyltransferase
MSFSVAMLSVHTSPLAVPGETKDAGGMNVYMRELARELGSLHTTVDIFTRWSNQSTPPIVQLSQNVRVIHIPAGPVSPIAKNELYQYLPAFTQHIDDFQHAEGRQYDVLHSHYWLSGVAALPLVERWDVPHVTMFHTIARLKQMANPHEPEPPLRLEMEQKVMKLADRIIATTAEERTQMIRFCGVTAGQVEVIPCGVDLRLFVRQDVQRARKRLGLKRDKPVLLFVGRLDPFKGPDVFLRAAALMKEEAQLVMVGGKARGDREVQELQRLASELKIRQRVHFLAARPQEELSQLYSAADITVVPSFHESFGLVAVESLACGTPVVATRAGGLMTVVRHGETGYLVPRSPGFFAERLDTLLRERDTLESMQLAARPSVLRFSWKGVARQMRDMYADVVDEVQELVAQ